MFESKENPESVKELAERRPLVSVVTIFLNEERFLAEAIESVLAQSYENWELILIDDGSTDESTAIAREYVRKYSDRIRYYDHTGHQRRGMSASRNLGCAMAKGEMLAFVDADDAWLKDKLERQVPRLAAAQGIDMLYGVTQYWYSWTRDESDLRRDRLWEPVESNTIFSPPNLLLGFLRDTVLMPCMGSILVRTEFVRRIGGWEESFEGLHEDQVFFSKVCMAGTVLATTDWVDRYRQHAGSCCAMGEAAGEVPAAKRRFLDWLKQALSSRGLLDKAHYDAIEWQSTRP